MSSQLDLHEVRADLAAFADDDEEVIVDAQGACVLVRGGDEIAFQLSSDADGRLYADRDGTREPYRSFLTHTLARLDVMAERILAKRLPLEHYIASEGILQAPSSEPRTGSALDLLADESRRHPPFSSRVLFITADAGQGKTALLRQFQHDQATRFLEGAASSLFWHVDLQGRQLLRLSEALMGDLGELRVPGLWMPAVIRMLRHHALVLAIDGFDELAAEQGGTDALGALALLVQQMGDRGMIVAASRRTFFDTDDYVSRARLVSRTGAGESQFDELSLQEWTRQEALRYLTAVSHEGRGFDDPEATYEEIATSLGSGSHTMITRPFLLAQIARALLRYNIQPSDFLHGVDDPLKGVGAVIEAFVDREVAAKWKQPDTGEPYLTNQQHLRLLSDVAEEMLRSQRAVLSVDTLETLAALLFEEWNIEQARRQQILEMVKMHVLLTPPEDDFRWRSFDHEEFQAWFTAYALKDRLLRLHAEGEAVSHDLLSVSQLSDAAAGYVCALLDRSPQQVRQILDGLAGLVKREWRPTHLQSNVGTLIPYMLEGIDFEEECELDARVIYSSLIFERSRLTNVVLKNGSFVNASFRHATWTDVRFVDCQMGELTLDRSSNYEGVVIATSSIEGIRVFDGDEESREYDPDRIRLVLGQLGIQIEETADPRGVNQEPLVDSDLRKLVRRVINLFRRTTVVSESTINQRFPNDARRVIEEVLPLMVRHNVAKSKHWRGSGNQQAWGPARSLETVEKADGDSQSEFSGFWSEVDSIRS